MKKCSECLVEKGENMFSKNRNQCKECRKKYRKEHYQKNKEKVLERCKEYYENNKESIKITHKNYYSNNLEKELDRRKKYYETNTEKIKIINKKNYENNKEFRLNQINEYREKNLEKLKLAAKLYYINNKSKIFNKYKERKNSDPLFKLKCNLRIITLNAFKAMGLKKNKKTEDILGCSVKEFKLYLESKFESWMNYENYGKYNGELNYGWDIDHIIPLSHAITEEEMLKLNHYSNLQPLCSKINRDIKKNNYPFNF